MTAELPPGPSVLPPPAEAFPGAGTEEVCPGQSLRGPDQALWKSLKAEGGETECNAKGPHQLHHHHHPPNGLITPELRHLRPARGKGRSPEEALSDSHGPRTAGCGGPASNGLEEALAACSLWGSDRGPDIRYVRYESELQMPEIMRLITKDLSEPYSIYTYRYFIHNWPQLCFLIRAISEDLIRHLDPFGNAHLKRAKAVVGEECVGAIVCKLDMHKKMFRRGYIAMLAVDSKYRRNGIGTNLVKKAIYAMVEGDCDEVCLSVSPAGDSILFLVLLTSFIFLSMGYPAMIWKTHNDTILARVPQFFTSIVLGLLPQAKLVDAVVDFSESTNKEQLKSYMTMVELHAKFIKNLTKRHGQVVLETEITNKSALKLYENLGFVRDKRLFRYYLNGVDALRLKLWLR